MHTLNRSTLLILLFIASCVTAFGWFIVTGNDFNNDDLSNFTAIQNGDLLQLMMTPLHGHWTPFHRFSTWLVYAIAPMRFEVAVVFLLLFHVGAMAYLYATLRRIGLELSAKVIICAYASCGLLIYGMIWWANAQLRVPHVLFCAAAIYHYIMWLKSGGKWHAGLAAAAFLIDLCVYQKAVLIPVYMLVCGYLAAPDRFRSGLVRAAGIPVALFAVGFAFTIAYTLLMPSSMHPGVGLIVSSHLAMVRSFFAALLGVTVYDPASAAGAPFNSALWATAAIWLVLLVASLRMAPGAWKAWLALLFMVSLDFLPLSTSNRTFFGPLIVYSYRYHFETVYLFALGAGFICASTITARWSKGRALRSPALAVAVVLIYAGVQMAALGYARTRSFEFGVSRQAHDYMGNLRRGLAEVVEPVPVFRDTEVPGYMSILVGPDRSSELVPLFLPNARFETSASQYYEVLGNGKLVRKTVRKASP